MDDLIVIILTMIIAGAGALGQLRKKKQAPVNGEAQSESESFWDMLQEDREDLDIIEDTDEDEADYENVVKPSLAEKEVVSKPVYQFNAKSEGQGAIRKEKIPVNKTAKLRSKLIEDFTLKKAVIYSEILNRKYK